MHIPTHDELQTEDYDGTVPCTYFQIFNLSSNQTALTVSTTTISHNPHWIHCAAFYLAFLVLNCISDFPEYELDYLWSSPWYTGIHHKLVSIQWQRSGKEWWKHWVSGLNDIKWLLDDFLKFRPEYLGISWWILRNCPEENVTGSQESFLNCLDSYWIWLVAL